MDALRQGLYDFLAADGTLTALLGTYRSATAIFDVTPGTEDMNDIEIPCILFEVVANNHFDTKTGQIRQAVVSIECITSTDSDPATIADRVHTLLHRQAITVSGWTNIITDVAGPVRGNYDELERVQILTVTFTLA